MATTIRVWEGSITPAYSATTWVEFGGEKVGGMEFREDGWDVQRTFYSTADGRIVVHEVEFGTVYTYGNILVYKNLDEACRRLVINKHYIDPYRKNYWSLHIGDPDAPTITLEQLMREREFENTLR